MKKIPFQRSAFKLSALGGITIALTLLTYYASSSVLPRMVFMAHRFDLYDKQGRLRFLRNGLTDFTDRDRAREMVAARYGFCDSTIAGCVISQQIRDSINAHNDKVVDLIGAKNGKYWYKKFNKDVERELKTEKKNRRDVRSNP